MKPWFYNKQSITEFKEPVVYKGLDINVRKTNVKPPYIATVKSPATGKEVIQGSLMVVAMAIAAALFFLLLDQILQFFLEIVLKVNF